MLQEGTIGDTLLGPALACFCVYGSLILVELHHAPDLSDFSCHMHALRKLSAK